MYSDLFRFEFKYRIHESRIESIEEDLMKLGAKRDRDKEFYIVTSLYFDTPNFSDYHDKVGGFLNRKKIRARVYDEGSGDVWLEIKEKHDMKIYKRRVAINQNEWVDFLSRLRVDKSAHERLSLQERSVIEEFTQEIAFTNRRPHIYVSYLRKPYMYTIGENTTRITLDYDLKAATAKSFFPDGGIVAVDPRYAVMEVKYKKILPGFMRQIIEKYDLSRDAYSKYALSYEAVRRWHPLYR